MHKCETSRSIRAKAHSHCASRPPIPTERSNNGFRFITMANRNSTRVQAPDNTFPVTRSSGSHQSAVMRGGTQSITEDGDATDQSEKRLWLPEPGHKCLYEEHSAPKYPGLATFFLSSSCTAPARHVCGFCSWVKYHATNSCFTGSFRGTAGSVASCRIRASGVINCSREFTPPDPTFLFLYRSLHSLRPVSTPSLPFRSVPLPPSFSLLVFHA